MQFTLWGGYDIMYDLVEFGHRFKCYREMKGYTYLSLSEASNISTTTIYKIEHAKGVVSIEILSILSYYLGCDLLKMIEKSASPISKKINSLTRDVEFDLSIRRYDNMNEYLKVLEALYVEATYDDGCIYSRTTFETLEKTIIWIRALECVADGNYVRAKSIIEAFISFEISEDFRSYLREYVKSTIDINLHCTYATIGILIGEFEKIELLYSYLHELWDNELYYLNKHYFLLRFIRVAYNHLSVKLDQQEYDYVESEANHIMMVINSERIGNETAQFVLLKETAVYLRDGGGTKGLIDALKGFEYEQKSHLISNIINGLESYGIQIVYS